jgi:hypothetical protein
LRQPTSSVTDEASLNGPYRKCVEWYKEITFKKAMARE